MKKVYFVDFDGVILDSQERFLKVMHDNVDFYDWSNYLTSLDWNSFLRECDEIDESLWALRKLQELSKLKGIITLIHSFEEGKQKLIFLREKDILVPIYYVLPFQCKNDVFIPNSSSILIDDKEKNCIEWKAAGGGALLFDPRMEKEEKGKIKSLKQLL